MHHIYKARRTEKELKAEGEEKKKAHPHYLPQQEIWLRGEEELVIRIAHFIATKTLCVSRGSFIPEVGGT